jgi:hypothetical protein
MVSLVTLGVAMLLAVRAYAPRAANLGRARLVAHRTGSGDFAGRVRISGKRRLYLECRGRGSPTVILEAGGGQNSRVWLAHKPGLPAVLPAVARFTRVCGCRTLAQGRGRLCGVRRRACLALLLLLDRSSTLSRLRSECRDDCDSATLGGPRRSRPREVERLKGAAGRRLAPSSVPMRWPAVHWS